MSTKVGTFMRLKFDTKEFVGELSNSITTAINLIDVSSKASCRASNSEYGRVVETGSVSSIATSDGNATAYNWKDAQAAAVSGTKIAATITQYDCTTGGKVSGSIHIAGTVLLSNITLDNPDNDRMTFSCDYQFDGPTVVTVTTLPTITGTLTAKKGATSQLSGSGTPAGTLPWKSGTPAIATVSNTGLVTGVEIGTSIITYTDNAGDSVSVVFTVTAA